MFMFNIHSVYMYLSFCLQYDDQLIPNFVCFGDGQVVYCGFSFVTATCCVWKRTARVNQNIKTLKLQAQKP